MPDGTLAESCSRLVPQWLGHQMRLTEQPGAVLAVAHQGKLVLEQAFGHADLARECR